jgi:hypothetical protein
MSPSKAAALVDKLARVAAPGSGASEAERVSAALEACKLITEHKLIVAQEIQGAGFFYSPPRYAAKPQPQPQPDVADFVNAPYTSTTQATPYRTAVAAFDVICGVEGCGEQIFAGERCWRRNKNGQVEYVHASCWWDS